jgi:hypothetical protein
MAPSGRLSGAAGRGCNEIPARFARRGCRVQRWALHRSVMLLDGRAGVMKSKECPMTNERIAEIIRRRLDEKFDYGEYVELMREYAKRLERAIEARGIVFFNPDVTSFN